MQLIFTVADWFEGLMRVAGYAGLIAAGVFLLGGVKHDPRLRGLKFIGGALAAFGALALAGALLRQVGFWLDMPERFFPAMWAHSLYYAVRQLMSGFIDLACFGAAAYGAMTLVKAFKPPAT